MSVSKMIMGQAANQYVAPTYVENLFSTFLWDGTGSAQTITNNIDLSGEGGLVWIKKRSGSANHTLQDTVRGATKHIRSSGDSSESTEAQTITAFNSNGFSLGTDDLVNASSSDYVGWTFRKRAKFFDVVTYTGTGPANAANEQQVSHNLGVKPGLVIIKSTSTTGNWWVFTDVIDGTNDYSYLNSTNSFGNSGNNVPTASVFNVGGVLNTSGVTYVAYLFANNDGDGDFGVTNDQDIIKCGSFTGVGSGAVNVNLGFEPQWIMVKNATRSEGWFIQDSMRGMSHADWEYLLANEASAAAGQTANRVVPTATGFTINNNGSSAFGQSGDKCIYMAIRRPMATPTSATDVFSTELQNAGGTYTKTTGFAADLIIQTDRSGTAGVHRPYDRLRGGTKYLETSNTSAEASGGTMEFDNNTGYTGVTSLNTVDWVWRRAPSYFDIVAYKSTTSAQALNHNLSAVPEMMWIKNRDDTKDWQVYHSALGNTKYLQLNTTDAEATASNRWNNTSPTATQFTVGTAQKVNDVTTTRNYIAYLFATVAGVSKVGSYTGTGSSNITVDCGFSNGASFVLIKRTDASGSWWIADTERGLVSGNDKLTELNATAAELTGYNMVEPSSSGFIVNGGANKDNSWNDSGGNYIFYAIA